MGYGIIFVGFQGNMSYLMCQVGICMFFQAEDGSYTAKPYNFYVLPRQFFNTPSGSREFICQVRYCHHAYESPWRLNKRFFILFINQMFFRLELSTIFNRGKN